MARPQSSPILAQIRSAKTVAEQTAALQALKNEIVGHVQKKEAWVGLGVLELIVRSLSSNRSPAKSGKDLAVQPVHRDLNAEEGLRMQALQLIASFANGKILVTGQMDTIPLTRRHRRSTIPTSARGI